ncbi:MAG: hypothetical protein H6852_05920 [Geminicoccaceae bacterium]|jgi:hypothetical protein|nr:hypothetical protein [Geminicoccaceae bacterium]
MNRYDQLSPAIKYAGLFFSWAPILVGGILTKSWIIAIAIFMTGFVLKYISMIFIGTVCKKMSMDSDGEVDGYQFNNIFIWPFLISGPLMNSLAAIYYIKFGMPF